MDMFIFKRKKALFSSKQKEVDVCQPDDLNRSATSMAENLIRGEGGESYRRGMKALFRAVPSLIQDVDPKLVKALTEKLQQTDT